MRRIGELIERVAPSEHTVLLVGESGTGKELAAQAIHRASPRTSVPLVDVNCGAIPENLLESELFGHEKGAFTGAETARPGLFELAHRGTLFLDEIGELPMGLQVKLLRVLETKTFYRVGGRRRIDVDTRVIAATNRELNREVEQGRFRKDLFYRINGIEIRLPTLRERPEDVPVLARHFASPRPISTPAMEALVRHPWPGNVRELKNVIDRATLMGAGPVIDVQDLFLDAAEPIDPPVAAILDGSTDLLPAPTGGGAPLREVEKQQILAVLEQVRWHRGQAAELLGISPKTLYRKLRSYGITN
jgi:DNA-binding NtrC family response regulator